MAKIHRKPLPSPWGADAAVLHLSRVWSNQDRIRLEQITLTTHAMVHSLVALWETSSEQPMAIPHGRLADSGFWRLIAQHDGSGILEVRNLPW